MPHTPATMALKRMGRALDILQGRRLAEEEFRRCGPWWHQDPGHHHRRTSLQTRVDQGAKAVEQEGQKSPGPVGQHSPGRQCHTRVVQDPLVKGLLVQDPLVKTY